MMNIPYTAVHFSVYESAKKLQITQRQSGRAAGGPGARGAAAGGGSGGGEKEEEEGLAVQVVAGGLAGGAAAAVTTPLDLVKTRLQTEGVSSSRRYGTTAVVRTLARDLQPAPIAGWLSRTTPAGSLLTPTHHAPPPRSCPCCGASRPKRAPPRCGAALARACSSTRPRRRCAGARTSR